MTVGSKSEVTVKTKTVDETYDALNDSGEHPKMHFIIKAKKGTYKNYIIIPSNTKASYENEINFILFSCGSVAFILLLSRLFADLSTAPSLVV